MSIVEETSKIAQSTINALNSVPVLLALVLLQFFILGAVTYLSIQRDANVHTRFMAMIERCTYPPAPDRRSGDEAPHSLEGPT
jgi:hypothetical protein